MSVRSILLMAVAAVCTTPTYCQQPFDDLIMPVPAVARVGPKSKEAAFLRRYEIKLDAYSSSVIFVDPVNVHTHLCKYSGNVFQPISECDYKGVKEDIVTPYSTESPYFSFPETRIWNAASLYFVKSCDIAVINVFSSNFKQFVQSGRCETQMTVGDSQMTSVFGRFRKLFIYKSTAESIAGFVSELKFFESTSGKLFISQNGLGFNEIRLSHIGEVKFFMRAPTKIFNTTIESFHVSGSQFSEVHMDFVHVGVINSGYLSVTEDTSCIISNSTFRDIAHGALQMKRGSLLKIEDTTIERMSYGAITVVEPARVILRNVSIAGKLVESLSPYLHRIHPEESQFFFIQNDTSHGCNVRDNISSCDLDFMGSTRTRVMWNRTNSSLLTIVLDNASNMSLAYNCLDFLFSNNVNGSVYDATNGLCDQAPGDVAFMRANLAPFHLNSVRKLTLVYVNIGNIMVWNVSSTSFDNVFIQNIDTMNIGKHPSYPNVWDNVTVSTMHLLRSASAMNITKGLFMMVHKLVLNHPGERTNITSTHFSFMDTNGLHLMAGELMLDMVSFLSVASDAVFIEQGAKLIIAGKVKVVADIFHAFPDQKIISVYSIDQIEFSDPKWRETLDHHIIVRKPYLEPVGNHYTVGYKQPHCSDELAALNILTCSFANATLAPVNVVVSHMRDRRVTHLGVDDADRLTLDDTCVEQMRFSNIGHIFLLGNLQCRTSLLIKDSRVDGLEEPVEELSLHNSTIDHLTVVESATSVAMVDSTALNYFVTSKTVKIENTNITSLFRINVLQRFSIEKSTIENLMEYSFAVQKGAEGYLNQTRIHWMKRHSFRNNAGKVTFRDSVIDNAPNSSIILMKDSHTIFINVEFKNLSSDSIVYEQGAQVTMENVTINGEKHTTLFNQLIMIHDNESDIVAPNLADPSYPFDDRDNDTAMHWVGVKMHRIAHSMSKTAATTEEAEVTTRIGNEETGPENSVQNANVSDNGYSPHSNGSMNATVVDSHLNDTRGSSSTTGPESGVPAAGTAVNNTVEPPPPPPPPSAAANATTKGAVRTTATARVSDPESLKDHRSEKTLTAGDAALIVIVLVVVFTAAGFIFVLASGAARSAHHRISEFRARFSRGQGTEEVTINQPQEAAAAEPVNDIRSRIMEATTDYQRFN